MTRLQNEPNEQTRVVVVDDHPMFLEGVATTLAAEPEITVAGAGASADDAVRLAQELLPDVMLLDVSMPGGGISAARLIAEHCPVIRIAMLTVSERDDDVLQSLKAGAHGYILKGIGSADLITLVKNLRRGDLYVSPGLAARILAENANDPASERSVNASAAKLRSDLTSRERQILTLIAEGKSNREIGDSLNIAEKTVKNYVSNVFQKLHVRNRVEASILAREMV